KLSTGSYLACGRCAGYRQHWRFVAAGTRLRFASAPHAMLPLSLRAMITLEQLRSNRNALFWTLHAAGWGAYAIAQYFGALLVERRTIEYQLVIGIAAVAGFVLSMPMRYIYR